MNCDNCTNLIDDKCKLGKHQTLGTLKGQDNKVVELKHPCIFKNEKYNLSFDTSHSLAMAKIAVASYFIIRKNSDVDELYSLLEKEKEYGNDNLIGQFNVISVIGMDIRAIDRLSKALASHNGKRLWNLRFILDDTTPESYIIDNCQLPYIIQLTNANDFAMIQNFKYKCFSGPVPELFGNIMSIRYIRKKIEELDASLQKENTV